jgi:hypothetical protein
LDSLWDVVRAEAERQLGLAGSSTPLLVTGHSKGGAVAALAAMRFQKTGLTPKVTTFAAPKPGNKAFADAYNVAIKHTRYEFGDDVVPHLPPSAPFLSVLAMVSFLGQRLRSLGVYNYERVGTLLYITSALQIIPDPNNSLLDQRRNRLVRLILTGQLQTIGDNHRIGCGYGYMSALCPSGVCPPPLPGSQPATG